MSTERVLESVIVADCGAGTTRAILVEAIDDVYRFIASAERPSTFEPPIDDLSVGVREALGALELATARRFLERNRPIMPQEGSGNGADALLTTMVSMPPLRLAILAIGGGPLVDALLDVARRTPTTVLPTLAIDESGRVDGHGRDTVATIARHHPSLLLLVAGGKAERALPKLLSLASEVVAAVAAQGLEDQPAVLFIGEERWHGDVTASFGSSAEIGLIDPAGADPGALAGIVEQELLDFANRRAAAGQPGFEEVSSWSAAPPLARSRAIDLVNRFMSIQFGCEVLTVELDEGATFCWARGRENCALSEPALDLALGAGNLLTTLSPTDVLRWLPFTISEDELVAWILNRVVRPFTIPTTGRDRLIEGAIARELLRTGVAELRGAGIGEVRPELIVGGSFFTRWPDPAAAMMALIDGVQPQAAGGVTQFALDRDGLLPAIGALGTVEPGRAAEVFEHDGLIDLGACVTVGGAPGAEIRGELEYPGGKTQPFTLTAGSLLRLPLGLGERATRLKIEPGGQGSVGRGPAGAALLLEGDDAPHGGLVGLLIDARGRPVQLPGDEQERIARLAAWMDALEG
jgi:hypothetical protein